MPKWPSSVTNCALLDHRGVFLEFVVFQNKVRADIFLEMLGFADCRHLLDNIA